MRAQYQTLFQTIIHTFRSHSAACLTILTILALLGPSGANADSTAGLGDSLTSTTSVTGSTTEPPADDRLWLRLEDYRHVPVQPGRAWNDLLQHLRTGFTLEPEMNKRVEAELRWYTRHPDYLERVFNRAQRYLPHITETLDERGLPLELALLPIVEGLGLDAVRCRMKQGQHAVERSVSFQVRRGELIEVAQRNVTAHGAR